VLESMLFTVPSQGGDGSTDGFFTMEGSDAAWSISRTAGAVFEEVPSIDGKTLVLPLNTRDCLSIIFAVPMNLKSNNWTLEWSEINDGAPSGYFGELSIGTSADGSNGITVRYGDGGFGDRMQFGGPLDSFANCWSIGFSKTALRGVLKRYALVQNAGAISVFVNGVKQMLALGVSNVYDKPTFTSSNPNTALTHIKIGSFQSNYPTMPARRGPVRFNPTVAKYSANYTPVPF